jgi:hypothetical protein
MELADLELEEVGFEVRFFEVESVIEGRDSRGKDTWARRLAGGGVACRKSDPR